MLDQRHIMLPLATSAQEKGPLCACWPLAISDVFIFNSPGWISLPWNCLVAFWTLHLSDVCSSRGRALCSLILSCVENCFCLFASEPNAGEVPLMPFGSEIESGGEQCLPSVLLVVGQSVRSEAKHIALLSASCHFTALGKAGVLLRVAKKHQSLFRSQKVKCGVRVSKNKSAFLLDAWMRW